MTSKSLFYGTYIPMERDNKYIAFCIHIQKAMHKLIYKQTRNIVSSVMPGSEVE